MEFIRKGLTVELYKADTIGAKKNVRFIEMSAYRGFF